jgi:integrase/recombinase XerD
MRIEKKAPVFSEKQYRKVLAGLKKDRFLKRNFAILACSFGLGLRAKELSQLSIDDVSTADGDLKDEVLLKRSVTKGGKQRLVYLTNDSVKKAIRAYTEERRRDEGVCFNQKSRLFKSQKGGGFSPNTMQMLLKRIFKEAGFENASSHSGRRTFATSLIEQGVDIKAVSVLMGHSSVAMTARYVDENPIRMRKICESLKMGV